MNNLQLTQRFLVAMKEIEIAQIKYLKKIQRQSPEKSLFSNRGFSTLYPINGKRVRFGKTVVSVTPFCQQCFRKGL